MDVAGEQPGPTGKGQESGPIGVVLRKSLRQGLHLLEGVSGSAAGQHGLGQGHPQGPFHVGRETRDQELAGFRVRVVEPAGPGEKDDQLGGNGIAGRVGRPQQLGGPLQQPHGDRGSPAHGVLGGPPKPLDGFLVAGCGSDRQMGGHLARRRPRSRQRPARLEMEGLTHREGEIRVHGLTDQFMMKGQALAGLGHHPGPEGLLEAVDQRRARRVEDRGEVGQRKRRAEDRGDAQHLNRLGGEGLQLTEDEQPE